MESSAQAVDCQWQFATLCSGGKLRNRGVRHSPSSTELLPVLEHVNCANFSLLMDILGSMHRE
jgi:hypothetical protein